MKTLSVAMASHLATRTTQLAWAATFTRRDGVIIRRCSGTRDKVIDGNTYTANSSFSLSGITCSAGTTVVDTLEMTMLPSNAFDKLDFLTGRWWGCRVEFNQFNWNSPTDGFIPWPTYRVADVTPKDGAFVMELRDLRVLWRQDYTLFTGKECQNRLGDYRCLVNLASFTHTFTITSVQASRRRFTASGLAQAADYFTEGICIFDDGAHENLDLLVLDHATGGIITLAVPTVEDIIVGQTGTLIAGCLKRLDDCRVKFNNILNMRAPGVHAPTVEEVLGG
jgi:uncharacterized phage protein (TIGR02218 family)